MLLESIERYDWSATVSLDGRWRKTVRVIDREGMTLKIHRTESVVAPVVAIVSFSVIRGSSAHYKTKREADQADRLESQQMLGPYHLLYQYRNTGWVLADGKMGGVIPVLTPDILESGRVTGLLRIPKDDEVMRAFTP